MIYKDIIKQLQTKFKKNKVLNHSITINMSKEKDEYFILHIIANSKQLKSKIILDKYIDLTDILLTKDDNIILTINTIYWLILNQISVYILYELNDKQLSKLLKLTKREITPILNTDSVRYVFRNNIKYILNKCIDSLNNKNPEIYLSIKNISQDINHN